MPEDVIISEGNHRITASSAKKVADNFLKLKNIPKTRGDDADLFSIMNSSQEALMHVINYNDGGYVIVAGDDRVYPILAYSEEGNLPHERSVYPEGLLFWIDTVIEQLDDLKASGIENDLLAKTVWKRFEEDHVATKTVPADTEYWNNLYDNIAGPLLTTTWHQHSPYNNHLPMISGTNNNALVGCVPIALSQIMRFYEYPNTYNWTSMFDNYANLHLYDLIDDIWNALGTNITYSSIGTSVPHSFNLADFLKNSFSYTSAIQTNYNPSTDRGIVRDELISNNRPVILKGVSGNYGHAWICDGVHEWQEDVFDGTTHNVYGLLFFHHVWGASDSSLNGWYGFNVFQPKSGNNYSNYNFGSNMKIVYNIMP